MIERENFEIFNAILFSGSSCRLVQFESNNELKINV